MRLARWFRPLAAALLLDLAACYTYRAAPLGSIGNGAERTRTLRVTYVRGQKVEGVAVVDDMATVVLREHWIVADTLWGIRWAAGSRASRDTAAIPLVAVREAEDLHLHAGTTAVALIGGLLVTVGIAAAVAVNSIGPPMSF